MKSPKLFVASFFFLLFFIHFSFSQFLHQPSIVWDDIKRISYDSMMSVAPQILAQGNTVHIWWYGNFNPFAEPDSGGGIQYARSTDGGETFSPQKTLAPFDSTALGTGKLAVSGNNVYMVNVARVDSPTYWSIGIIRSTDAGATWGKRKILGAYSLKAFTAKDSNLFIYVTYVENNKYKNGMLISHDYGNTWDSLEIKIQLSTWLAQLAQTKNTLHLIRAVLNYGSEIVYNRSFDSGIMWTYEDTLSVADQINSYNPHLWANNENNLLLTFDDQKYGGDFRTVLFRKSFNDGADWSNETILSQFATAIGGNVDGDRKNVVVSWYNSSNTINNARLKISEDEGDTWSQIIDVTPDTAWAIDASVAISGNTIHYTWWYQSTGEIYYRRGIIQPTEVVEKPEEHPQEFALNQNYPNPFNNSTIISFTLPRKENVTLQLYDAVGRLVQTLFEGNRDAGSHSFNFSGEHLSSGVYFVLLKTGNQILSRKIVMIK